MISCPRMVNWGSEWDALQFDGARPLFPGFGEDTVVCVIAVAWQ